MRIGDISPRFRIEYKGPSRSTSDDRKEVLEKYPFCPQDYIDLMDEMNGFFLMFDYEGGGWLQISMMSFGDTNDFKDIYPLSYMDGCFYFATDGDLSYVYSVTEGHKEGVYVMDTAGPLLEEAGYIAPSIKSMLCDDLSWITRD